MGQGGLVLVKPLLSFIRIYPNPLQPRVPKPFLTPGPLQPLSQAHGDIDTATNSCISGIQRSADVDREHIQEVMQKCQDHAKTNFKLFFVFKNRYSHFVFIQFLEDLLSILRPVSVSILKAQDLLQGQPSTPVKGTK